MSEGCVCVREGCICVSEGGGFRAQCRICECVDPVSRLVQFLKEKKSECVDPVSHLVQIFVSF